MGKHARLDGIEPPAFGFEERGVQKSREPDRTAARFWAKVEKGPGCWRWTGAVTSAGYGSFAVVTSPRPRSASAHKVAWERANGPVPAGMVLLHACDNRLCVRVDHLRVGTVADNNADMMAKGRHRHGDGKNSGNRLTGEERRRCRRLAEAVASGRISLVAAETKAVRR